jgi:hypothetical protein
MGLFGLFNKNKKETLDKGLEKTKQSVFSKLTRAIAGKSKVDDEVLDNLEEVLITSDVGVDTTLKIIERIEERVARDKYVSTSELNIILREEIASLLSENNTDDLDNWDLPQDHKPYVMLVRDGADSVDLSYEPHNGTQTLTVTVSETLDSQLSILNYLHLIDNKTGADIDLLATPSYTFESKTGDYASRFKLVFSANEPDGPSTGSGSFAYYNGSEWQISNMGEATLQVIDVTGRIVKNETISGNASISLNEVPGVYVMRLVNGENVKTQKIVVR